MASAVLVQCKEGEWTKVATQVTSLYLRLPLISGAFAFIWTSRLTGTSAPSNLDKTDANLAVKLFSSASSEKIEFNLNQDIYVWLEDANIHKTDFGYIRIDTVAQSTLSYSNNGYITTSYEDDYTRQGYKWIHQNVLTVPNGLSYVLFNPTALTALNLMCIPLPSAIDIVAGPVQLLLYEDTDYSGGADMIVYNPERNDSHVKHTLLTFGSSAVITGADKGTLLRSVKKGTSGGFFQAPTGGKGEGSSATFLDTTKKYLFELNNTNGVAIDLTLTIVWFEIPKDL